MEKKEFSVLAAAIRTLYPNEIPNHAAMDLWYSLLSDLSYESANYALYNWAKTNHFPPKPADIIFGAESYNFEVYLAQNYNNSVQKYIEMQDRKKLE